MASARSLAFFIASVLLLTGAPAVAQFTDAYKIADVAGGAPYFGSTFPGSGATLFIEYQGAADPSPRVYFFASQGWDSLHTADETGLYKTDGTRQGTSFVAPFTEITEMAVVNGNLLISGSTPLWGRELWSSDGSTVSLVKDIYPGTVSSNPARFFVVPAGLVSPGELLLFAASPDALGPSLQVSDGTTAGTAVLETFKDPREFIAFNGRVFLTAKVSQAATETNLWSWSPTASQLVESRVEGGLAAVGTTLFIAMRTGSTAVGRMQTEVWKTDGTPGAAVPLSSLWTGGDAAVSDLTVVGTTVFFAACDPAIGRGLYKTDGTTVTLVKDFLVPGGTVPAPANSCDPANGPDQLAAINGKLYFVVDDGNHGQELWTSDGTTAGTVLVQDLYPGAEPSDPMLNAGSCGRSACRAVTAGGFFFTARTKETGRELWYCDGASVRQAGDPDPGVRSGVASDRMVLVGDKVFFAGSDTDGGSEPWALPLAPTLSVADVSVAESTGPAVLTVRLMPPNPSATVTVDWSTSDGTAVGGIDFTASSGALTFAPGVASQTITIPITQDGVQEPDEVFHVVLSNAANAEIVTSPADVAIYDDDAPVLTIAFVPPTTTPPPPFTALKEGYTATFAVTAPAPHAAPITVDYRAVAVTANGGTDFTRKSSIAPGVHALVHTPLTFPPNPGTTPQTLNISVPTTNDQTYEDRWKEFRVELFNPVGASVVTRFDTAAIENDDIPGADAAYLPTVSLGSKTVTEGNTFATFRATLNDPSEYTARLYWMSGVAGENPPADPGLDYRNTSGFFVFRPGETTHDVTVEVFDDVIDEPDEKYWVDIDTVTAVGAIVGVGRGSGIITDNDTGTLAIANPAPVTEGDVGSTNVTFNITLSTPYYRDFTIDFATGGGTALPGVDYTATQGTLLFPKGTTSNSVIVPVLGDVIDEANETFNLILSNSTGPGFADSSATATITDDDTTVSVADASATEGNTGTTLMTFTVSTADNAGNKTPFTVDYATAAGGAQPATPGVDYVEKSGTLSFPAGTKSQTFTVQVNGDLIDEPAETFLVHLSNSTGPLILDGEAVGTINDNDTATVAVNNVTVTEGNSGTTDAVFTVSINTPYYRDFTVNWATAPGTTNPATEGVDYLAGSGTLTFPAGTTSQTLAVAVVGDTLDEANETFKVLLSSSTGPTISDGEGIGTITDDDALTIDVADVEVVEGDSGTTPATFTLTVSADHAQTVTVNVATSAGGPTPPAATAGTDYTTLLSTLVTFAPGVLSQQVSVSVIGDTVVEANNESFALTLSNATGGAILARTKALGVILDDDSSRTISLSPLSVAVAEPLAGTADATFTVTLSADAGRTITVNYATADGSALAGSDYTSASGTLSFAPGDRTKTVSVAVLADSLVEATETFTLTLSAPTNGTIAAGAGTATASISDSLSQIPLGFYTVAPCRLVDTRQPAPGSPLVANVPRTFPVVGTCLIPPTARAISYNVTVTGATSTGNVRMFPGGTPAPSTSTVNFKAAQTRANNGIVSLGTLGDVGVMLSPAGTAHVIIDLNGYME